MALRINIFTSDGKDWFNRQISSEIRENNIVVCNDSSLEKEWDIVVIYEELIKPVKVKCRQTIFINGEPPLASVYPYDFLKQFDTVISCRKDLKHQNVINKQLSLPWHIGFSWTNKTYNWDIDDFQYSKEIEKRKMVSIITSNQNQLPGHRIRLKIINILKNSFANQIDYYGRGIQFIDDKSDALLPYKFHICFENSEIDDYWTEKIADPILAEAIPVYIGCTNIKKYFPEDCIICHRSNDIEGIKRTIKDILENGDTIYTEKKESLLIAKKRILKEYNIFETLASEYIFHDMKQVEIRPKYLSRYYTSQLLVMKVFRKFLKILGF